MKKKVSLFFVTVVMLVGLALFGSMSAFAAADTDDHGWSRRVNAGDYIDVKTNTQTGYSEIQMLYANGAYNTSAIDVARPFRITIKYDGMGTDWGPAFMLTDNPTSANHFSGAGSKPVVGYNQSMNNPSAWLNAKIQWCAPRDAGFSPIQLVNAASAGFYNGVTGTYDGEKAYLSMGSNTKVRKGSVYDFFFEIEEKEGDKTAQSGSRLTLTETLADGSTAQDVYWLDVKRGNFENNKAYLGMAAVAHSNDYLSIKIAKENTLLKSAASGFTLEELIINGESRDVSVNSFNAYYGDTLKFKISGENALVKVGTAILAPAADGYYYYYMGNGRTTLSISAADKQYRSVTYNTDGGSDIYALKVADGSATPRPANDPVKEGTVFKGWYNSDLTTPYDFDAPLSADAVVYAKWAQMHVVTYHLGTFAECEKLVEENQAFPELTLGDFHIFGRTNNKNFYTDVNSVETEWYSDEACTQKFDFESKVSEPADLYGKLVETKRYAYTQAHGWDSIRSLKDSDNTVFMDSTLARSVFDSFEDGTVLYNLNGVATYGLYSRGLDVGKPIKMDITMNNGIKNGWVVLSLFDKYTLAQLSEAEGYDKKDAGSLIGFGFSPTDGRFMAEALDLPTDEYGTVIKDFVANGKISVEIHIGEVKADSYITINGEKAIMLNVTRSDFDNGLAYLNLSTFENVQVRIKVWQDLEFNALQCEGGSVTVEQRGAYAVAKVSPDKNYELKQITINGKPAQIDTDGEYIELAENEYLLVIEDYRNFSIAAEFEKIGDKKDDEGKGGGCGGSAATTGSAAAVVLVLAAAALIARGKKGGMQKD